ncbi:MAG: MFS transporter [Actinobacteria bacterium]|nr:MFS transporter [Actinomycetota bacterium]
MMKRPFRQLPREVPILAAVAFLVAAGFGFIAPATPIFARSFGVSQAAAGAVVSLFAFARFSTGLTAGRLVDRFGAQKMMAMGLFIVSFSALLAAFSQNYYQLLFFRGAGGFGSAIFTVAATTILLRVVSDDQRGQAQSTYQSGYLFGSIAGPVFGGALIEFSLRAPFFVYSCTVAAAGLVAVIYLANSSSAQPLDSAGTSGAEVTMRIRDAFRVHGFQVAILCSFAAACSITGVRISLIPLFATEGLGLRPVALGIGLAVATIIQGLTLIPAGKFVDSRGRRTSILIGGVISLVGLAMFAFVENYPGFIVGMALAGLGASFMSSAPAALVGDVTRGQSGRVIAAWQMSSDFGFMVGPIAMGFVADKQSYSAAFLIAALFLSPVIIRTLNLPETRRSHLPAPYEP